MGELFAASGGLTSSKGGETPQRAGFAESGGLASAMGGLSTLAGSYAQSQAMAAQGTYQKSLSEINAQIAETRAQDAIKRGETEANQQRQKTGAIAGAQRVGFAAQGVDIGSGTAQEVQRQTHEQGALDALTIKNNAYREAFGYKVDAINQRSQGQFDAMSAKYNAQATLLTGGMNAASSFARSYAEYKKG